MKNLTQDYVAKRSGISTKWLGRIENGSEQVSEKILTSVSQVLEVDKEVIEHFHERPIFQNCNNSVV
jgi:transcriptional regulator with XRE-family HTH domain